MNYDDLKKDLIMTDSGDPWGNCMGWLFAVAEVLHFERDGAPEEWQFRPSPLAKGPEEISEVDSCRLADTEDLVRFGSLLCRYNNMLKAAGQDY